MVKKLDKFTKLCQNLPTTHYPLPIQESPKSGIELGNGCYKIQLATTSVPTGKNGGFRIIYYYLDQDNNLYLMTIYSKTEVENISEEKIVEILKTNDLLGG